MPWEIADREHPQRAGLRFASLSRADDAIERTDPRDRFYLRWVNKNGGTDNER